MNYSYLAILPCTFALIAACTPLDKGDSDPSSTMTTGLTDDATGTDAPTGADTDADTLAQCNEIDPSVSAMYTLTATGWVVQPNQYETLESACSVDSVTSEGDAVTTALSCEVDGSPQTATLTIAATPAGAVDWGPGDAVQLTALVWNEGDFGSGRNVQLRTPGGELLLCAGDGLMDSLFIHRCQPLKITPVDACVEAEGPRRVRLDFEPVDGPVVGVFHGHRGVLPISDDAVLAIDVEQALSAGPADGHGLKVLLRRIQPGG